VTRMYANLCCALAVLALGVTVPLSAQSNRPTIAVLNFDYGSLEHWWSGNQDIGQGISDMLVD
jgi:hypothetical protein